MLVQLNCLATGETISASEYSSAARIIRKMSCRLESWRDGTSGTALCAAVTILRYSSVYFARFPRALSAGYFAAFSASLARIAASGSIPASSAKSRQ